MRYGNGKHLPGLGEETWLCCKKMSAHVTWERALIEHPIEGRDGMIRTAVLRTPEGRKITRPIQLVIPLEVDQGGEDVKECLSS